MPRPGCGTRPPCRNLVNPPASAWLQEWPRGTWVCLCRSAKSDRSLWWGHALVTRTAEAGAPRRVLDSPAARPGSRAERLESGEVWITLESQGPQGAGEPLRRSLTGHWHPGRPHCPPC